VGKKRKIMQRPDAYLPLEFDPGQDAQMDRYEAIVEMGGERRRVQVFAMRLPVQATVQGTIPGSAL
jgi:hypothetical protein